MLERSLVSSQLPLLPQDSREERQVISTTAFYSPAVKEGPRREDPDQHQLGSQVPRGLTSDTQDSVLLGVKRHLCFTQTCATPSGQVPQSMAES